MKNNLLLYLLFFLVLSSPAESKDDKTTGSRVKAPYTSLSGDSLRIVSYNLLFEKKEPSAAPQKWRNRINTVTTYIDSCHFDVIGTQEALTFQVNDLLKALPDFDKVGTDLGGGTNNPKAENAALFYRKSKLEILENGDFWFSETPQEGGSHSWNSGYPRKCTWAKFRIKATGHVFYVFNSHFYVFAEGHKAKIQCAIILKEKIAQIAGKAPVLCTGDFNAAPDTQTLNLLLADSLLKDFKTIAKKQSGPVGTYHGFETSIAPTNRIDYVLVNSPFDVINYRVIEDELSNGRFGSDHLPVIVDIILR